MALLTLSSSVLWCCLAWVVGWALGRVFGGWLVCWVVGWLGVGLGVGRVVWCGVGLSFLVWEFGLSFLGLGLASDSCGWRLGCAGIWCVQLSGWLLGQIGRWLVARSDTDLTVVRFTWGVWCCRCLCVCLCVSVCVSVRVCVK